MKDLTSIGKKNCQIFGPATRYVYCIVSLMAIVATTFFVDGLQYTVPAFLPFLAVMSVVYVRSRRIVRA